MESTLAVAGEGHSTQRLPFFSSVLERETGSFYNSLKLCGKNFKLQSYQGILQEQVEGLNINIKGSKINEEASQKEVQNIEPIIEEDEPSYLMSIDEALDDDYWILAMQAKLNQFERCQVLELVPRPNDYPIVGRQLGFRSKMDENGIITRNKARLVAKEYSQEECIDYIETYALVARLEAIRMCDPPKQHVMHTKINEHAINKLDFVYVNNFWVRKETVNDPKFVGDEDCEDTFLEPSVTPSATLSAGPSSHPSVGHSYPPMSTSFDNEQAYSRLLSFMESMDARVVHKLDALEAQNQELLHHQ
ncbi:Uncharacterized protein TCM_018238 [Theobroma cacao]|uniref:Uncharacterized protein n=1 Tax=Theobroma cacao TaxID=3641 RepID=A0A061EEB1_THECC|nr:Uncharacterized protein TCM_018238 [Theobroma cacao]